MLALALKLSTEVNKQQRRQFQPAGFGFDAVAGFFDATACAFMSTAALYRSATGLAAAAGFEAVAGLDLRASLALGFLTGGGRLPRAVEPMRGLDTAESMFNM